MAIYELYPSGDATGVSDTTAVAAKVALLGADDTLWLHGGQWYYLPTADGNWITFTQNGQTLLLGDNDVAFKVVFVGKGAATTTVSAFFINGKTNITIKASSSSYPAMVNGNRATLNAAGITFGVGITVANQNVWGTNNNLLFQDIAFYDLVTSGYIIQSAQGGTINRVYTWATSAPVGSGHGNDWDAVAYGKPSKDWTITDCVLDSYGNECTKHENCTNITYNNVTFLNVVTLAQDNAQPYDELKNIYFNGCKFYGPISHVFLKRKDSAAAAGAFWGAAFHANPAGTLTLTPDGAAGAGKTATFSLASLKGDATDIGKVIVQSGTTNALGYSIITANISTTQCTVTTWQAWSSAGPIAAADVFISTTLNNTGSGDITYSGCQFIGDGACAWGFDPSDGTSSTQQNYGTITFTNCTAIDDDGIIGGNQMYLFPAGVTPTVSGNIGKTTVNRHYVRPTAPAKVSATASGLNGKYSYPCSWLAATSINPTLTSTTSGTGDEIIIMDGVYNTYDSGAPANSEGISNANGTGNLISFTGIGFPLTIRAKHKWKVILDGTNSSATARIGILDSTAITGSKVSGLVVQNFTHGTNNIGANLSSSNNTEISHCWFNNITTQNGGAGIRSTTTGAATFDTNLITNCSCTVGAGGGGMYTTSVNATYNRLYFDTCSTTVQMGGAARFDFATLGTVTNCVAVNCVATGVNGGGFAGKNFKLINCTGLNNTAAAGNDISIPNVVKDASAAYTGHLISCIMYSASPVDVAGASGTGGFDTCDFNAASVAAFTGSGTKTDIGGNIFQQAPLFMSSATVFNPRLQSSASPCYRTGKALAAANNVSWDYDGNPFNVTTPNMGAFSHKVA